MIAEELIELLKPYIGTGLPIKIMTLDEGLDDLHGINAVYFKSYYSWSDEKRHVEDTGTDDKIKEGLRIG